MEVTVDGRKITLDEPVTALEAAKMAGVDIPTLCWHPRVSILGACRLCMIEVEGINRLLAACTTQVSDGMAITTKSPQLTKVREIMLELLLCRHPLDCPTCVKGGECELQELTYRYSSPQNRFPENPAPYPVKDPSPFLERDPKKCVLCRRCVRVCREVRGVTVLGAMERGYHKRVGTYFQQPLDSDFQEPYNCEFCGACIDICPVGALNSKQHKFRARTWEGEKSSTVCPFCSVGCRLTLQVKEGELVRAVPCEGPNNQDQACFRGRFGTEYANSTSRIITPILRRTGGQVPAERAEALRWLAEVVRAGGNVEAILSSSLTSEEIGAVDDFMSTLLPEAALRAVDTLGLEESVPYDALAGGDWNDLDDADLILVTGQDFTVFEPVAGVRIRVSRQKSAASLVVLDSRDALLGGEADLWLRPAGAGLPLFLGAVLKVLAASHAVRLRAAPQEDLISSAAAAHEAEDALGLPRGAVEDLAGRLAQSGRTVLMGHRGWYDPQGAVPALLAEFDRVLGGEGSRGIIYLGRDCNSRRAGLTRRGGGGEGKRDLLLLFGADPLGTAPPASELRSLVADAKTTVVFDTFITETARAADALFPLPSYAEKEGTFRSCNGLDQHLTRAIDPPPGVPPLWETLDDIAAELGRSVSFAHSGEGEVKSPPPATGAAEGTGAAAPVPTGERTILLRAIPIADHRLRLVDESAALFPGKRLEVHPGDLETLGADDGDRVRVTSGSATIELTLRADLKIPPGQAHLPVDPEDAELMTFVMSADRPEGWPADHLRLAGLQKAAGKGTE